MSGKNSLSQLVAKLVAGNYCDDRQGVRDTKESLVGLFLDGNNKLIPYEAREKIRDRLYSAFEQSIFYYSTIRLTCLSPQQKDEYKVKLRSAVVDFLEVNVKCKVIMPEEYILHLHSIWQEGGEKLLASLDKLVQQLEAQKMLGSIV